MIGQDIEANNLGVVFVITIGEGQSWRTSSERASFFLKTESEVILSRELWACVICTTAC